MKVVYKAENIIDANLIKGLLEAEGMLAFVNGHHLQGAIGELPAMGIVSVSVSEIDVDGARRIIRDFEQNRAAPEEEAENLSLDKGIQGKGTG